MMNPQRHQIGRMVLEIDCDRLDEIWSFQHEISELVHRRVMPALEQLFDQLVGVDEVIRLDQVVVQLELVDSQDFADDFVRHLLEALQHTLNERLAGLSPNWEARLGGNGSGSLEWEAQPGSGDPPGTLPSFQSRSDRSEAPWPEVATAEPSRRDRSEADWEVLLYFLQYGRLPWWSSSFDWSDWIVCWEAVMQAGTHWQLPLRALLKASPVVRQRLVTQFPEAFRHQVVLQLQPGWFQWPTRLVQADHLMRALSRGDRTLQWAHTQAWLRLLTELGQTDSALCPFPSLSWISAWLADLLHWLRQEGFSRASLMRQPDSLEGTGAASPESAIHLSRDGEATLGDLSGGAIAFLRSRIESMPLADRSLWLTALDQSISPSARNAALSSLQSDTTAPSEQREQPTAAPSPFSPEEDAVGLFIHQAGLVILHPFLPVYFEAVGLLEGEAFRDETAQQTALYLLHYLATGQTQAAEYELVLPKLLCGWPLHDPVMGNPDLPQAALTEADHLLQTVIDYWQALKSTSPAGLREGFLQRDGKLTRLDGGDWRLQVEQQGIDVLLSRLPWGFSVITLPWMESMIMVEWS